MRCSTTASSRRSKTLLCLKAQSDQHSPLNDDGGPDIAGYNKQLEQLGSPKWFSVPWLFSECYLYRLVIAQDTSTRPFSDVTMMEGE